MNALRVFCILTLLINVLMVATTASAQVEATQLLQLEQVLPVIQAREIQLAQLLTQLGPRHPQVLQLRQEIAALNSRLAELDPHIHSDPADQLRHTMQRFADTMDLLGNQIEAIDRLGNEMGAEKSEPRKEFLESSQAMFLAAKTHLAELELLLGNKVQDVAPGGYNVHQMEILMQAQQVAEAQKLQAQAMEAAAVDLLKRATENANQLQSSEPRMDQFDERLSRIEILLEKLTANDAGVETSESDR